MSANTGRVGHPVPITAEVIAGEDPSGDVKILALDADGNINVNVTSSGSAIEDGVDSAIKATVKDYADSNPLAVVLVDTSGDPYVASGGGGGDATAANQVLEIAAINKINAQILDFDTGGGTANTVVLGLALPASGGPVAGGTVTNPIHTIVDSGSITTGGLTDTQLRATPVPISGTVTANAGTNLNTSALATAAKQPALGTAGSASADVITIQGIASGTVVPISGTVTATVASTTITGNVTVVQPTGTNLHAVLDTTSTTAVTQATAANLNATVIGAGSAGTANAGVVTVQGIASMTKLLVTPDSVALPANQSVNMAQVGGVTTSVSNGTVDTGTQRVAIASNNTAFPVTVTNATAANLNAAVVGTGTAGSAAGGILTVQGVASMTKLLVTPDSVALPANQSVNMAQVGGTTVVTAGVAGTQAVGGNVANGVTATTNPVPVGGVFTTSPTTLTTGQTATMQFTAAQNIKNDVTTIAGTAADTNSGNKSAGTLRVVLATDQPALTNKLLVTPDANSAINLAQVNGTTTVNGGSAAGILAVGGPNATNVAITGNPVNNGAQAVSSENAAVTTARQVQLVADLVGKLIVLPYANPENFVSGAITSAMTGTTTTSLIAAPASGLRNYITQITVSNAHASQGTDIIIQDGSGGTTLYTIPAAANYGGATVTFPTPLRQPTTATAIYCANVTTGASTKVSASGYKGA